MVASRSWLVDHFFHHPWPAGFIVLVTSLRARPDAGCLFSLLASNLERGVASIHEVVLDVSAIAHIHVVLA